MRKRRWPRVLLIVALTLVALLWIGKITLLDSPAAPGAEYVIDVDALHRVATAGGPLPQSLEVEKVGDFAFPQTLVVAGDGFRMHPMVLLAHRVVWADHSMLIDTAMSPAAAKNLPRSHMDAAAFERVEAAMRKASLVVFTHEHTDHVGGVAAARDFSAIAKKVRITNAQLNGPRFERDDFPPGAIAQLEPFDYQGLYAVSPGVVLQKAPGHSTGSQLVYVELATGARFLFVGDIAWSFDNITRQVGRPGIATLLMKEDRPAVASQVRAIGRLPPDVHVIVAHDPAALEKDLAAGLYRWGFSDL